VGVPAMVIRKDTPGSTSGTNGDYEMLQASGGLLWTRVTFNEQLPAGTNAIGVVDTELPAAAALGDGAAANPTAPTVGNIHLLMNATTMDRQRAILNAMDSNGIGIAAAGLMAQLDDTAPSSVTENQFGPLRMSSRRVLMVEGVPSGVSQQVEGGVAHGATSVGNPLLMGAEAIAHGANPSAIAAGQRSKLYANRAGIPFVVGGHPNVVTIEVAASGTTTDSAIVTVSTGTKIVVTQAQVITDNANTTFPQVRIGFGTTTTPTTSGVVLTHPGLPAGGGVSRGDGSGIIGIGADNEDLRWTTAASATAMVRALVSYYTIES
jgi:hypothetical protein